VKSITNFHDLTSNMSKTANFYSGNNKKRKRNGISTGSSPSFHVTRTDIAHSNLKKKSEDLLPFRKALPIWSHAETIRSHLKGSKDVLILAGETGSGKSTQVPQFLMEASWCTDCIAITQPRRVAAISLAKRVAAEVGTPLGSASPASKVGYSVRFDNCTSPSTKIKFLTEGTLLQEMLRDPALKKYSVVIVDEVHERSVNVDLILGFLRRLLVDASGLREGKPLKVIVMSATANVSALVEFFAQSYLNKDAKSADIPKSDSQIKANGAIKTPAELKESRQVSSCSIPGRMFPVEATYLPEPTNDWIASAFNLIFQIHHKEPLPGDILVFLTGQETIETLERLVNEQAENLDPNVPKVQDAILNHLNFSNSP
jgi:ATP-dependent RNA helicase DHR2